MVGGNLSSGGGGGGLYGLTPIFLEFLRVNPELLIPATTNNKKWGDSSWWA